MFIRAFCFRVGWFTVKTWIIIQSVWKLGYIYIYIYILFVGVHTVLSANNFRFSSEIPQRAFFLPISHFGSPPQNMHSGRTKTICFTKSCDVFFMTLLTLFMQTRKGGGGEEKEQRIGCMCKLWSNKWVLWRSQWWGSIGLMIQGVNPYMQTHSNWFSPIDFTCASAALVKMGTCICIWWWNSDSD